MHLIKHKVLLVNYEAFYDNKLDFAMSKFLKVIWNFVKLRKGKSFANPSKLSLFLKRPETS